jgi:DNA-binding MarR family transcriptional regulator
MEVAMSPNTPVLQERLEALLVEVNGLANRLKATDPRVAIPSGSRAALQILQRCGPQTVPQIARARFSSRQNIQILVNRLQQEGLVELVGNPEHKRSALVRLTSRGQAAIAQATAEETRLSTELLPEFSPTELSYATEVLNKLRKLLDGKKAGLANEEPRIKERSPKNAEVEPERSSRQEQLVSGLGGTELTEDGEIPVSLL